MYWRKRGLLLTPSGALPWMHTHASVPLAEPRADGRVRIYFSGRDERNRSYPGSVELRLGDATAAHPTPTGPLLSLGEPGMFDDAGVMPSWVVVDGQSHYLYYTGWSLAAAVPFRNAIGLAVSRDGGRTFVRYSTGPILDRSVHDPAFVASPCVLRDGGRWRMWYSSCVGWERLPTGLRHRYHIKHAESADGLDWRASGTVCIDFRSPDEYAISRPCVIRDPDRYRMWFSHRGESYRIGYAESLDGIHWTRRDEGAGLEVSATGWDSEMVCYAFVFDQGGSRHMLYNGNAFGRDGVGHAVLEEP